jgi:hypothetical protein
VAGAIHKNLHAAEFCAHRLQKPLEAGVVGDIASFDERPAAKRHNLCGSVSYRFTTPSRGHNIRACLGESPTEGQPDTGGSPDDHRRFVCQIKKRMTHEALLRFPGCGEYRAKLPGQLYPSKSPAWLG